VPSDFVGVKQYKFDDRLAGYLKQARQLSDQEDAAAIMLMLPGPTDWAKLREHAGGNQVVLAADTPDELEGAVEAGLATVPLNMPQAPVIEKLTQALLAAVALEILAPGAGVVVIYSGFEPETVDSISFIRLDEHLGRLTARDLKQLVTSVPLETLKIVVDLAIEIGREGREGQPVGTLFVVGDTRKVVTHCQPAGFDPVKGYARGERDLHDPRVREAVKEVAGLDGAFVIAGDGTVERAAQLIDAPYSDLALPKGFGARHWAGAAISNVTNAIAVVVSQSSGTVRIFQSGDCVLRIEPFRQAMKWREFDFEPPTSDDE
jgi:DNA integrity scanning protein DisA with diadenylate cyclase activity